MNEEVPTPSPSSVSQRQQSINPHQMAASPHSEQQTMRNLISDLRRLRGERIDWLLSVLAGVLTLLIFIFAPLQAMGITAFHLFADGLLLAIIVGMVIISNSPTALVLMSLALISNIAVFFLRIYYPVPYHLHILAGAWLVIACTLGVVVIQAVFSNALSHITELLERSFCTC
jgi:hypothetical protein